MDTNRYTVLLVDDEEEVTQIIMKKIDWEGLGFSVIGSANNGVKALEMVEEFQPDIVMTDIRMPYMDGMELAHRVKAEFPSTRIFLFTGFDEFEYAKEAIHLEVEEYILKPVNAAELTRVFSQTKIKLDQEINEKRNAEILQNYYIESLPFLQTNFYVTLIEGRIQEDELGKYLEDYQISLPGPVYCCVVIHTSSSQDSEEMSPLLLSTSVQKQVKERLAQKWRAQYFSYLGNSVLIAQLANEGEVSELTDECDRFCKYARRMIGAVVTAGVGKVCRLLSELQQSYEGAREAVSYRGIYGTVRAINIREIVPQGTVQPEEETDTQLAGLFRAIRFGEENEVREAVAAYIRQAVVPVTSLQQHQIGRMELLSALYRFSVSNEISDRAFSGDMGKLYTFLLEKGPKELEGWLLSLSLSFRETLIRARSRSTKTYVKRAEEYIRSSFSDAELSLDYVCELLGVSNSYFSTVFKKETGKSFTAYLTDYLIAMRQISDAAYYNAVKEYDFSSESQEIQRNLNLLYQANKENLRSIALYNQYGSLLAAEPVAVQKEDPDVTRQSWFEDAMQEVENMHFSTPHIQNLFRDSAFRYYWVLSLSRMVEITNNGDTQMGVLLVDMDFSSISRQMKKLNDSTKGEYYYLCDSKGNMIYHPRQIQLRDGIGRENNLAAASYRDGVYEEAFGGENRTVVVNTISYTGWKLVGVLPDAMFTHGMINVRYFIAMMLLLMAMMLVIISRIVSVRISRPILKLNTSVLEYEAGARPEIYIGGSQEIRHLGYSIQKSYEKIEHLMADIVWEQNERRKSELDALQSQINPHFLYNTLDSITWMIEGEKNDEAAYMITQLARFFRISLSKGYTVIRVEDELQHAQCYMNIQKLRSRDSFTLRFDVEEAVKSCCIVKLVLQPLLENAINYGVRGMDDGEIAVIGRVREGSVILSVQDNGIGIPKEEAELLLTDSERVHKHGSGVGLVNVNQRIQILFGKEYGLRIESEPDEGTTVSVCIPAIPFTEENRKRLENGTALGRKKWEEQGESNEK